MRINIFFCAVGDLTTFFKETYGSRDTSVSEGDWIKGMKALRIKYSRRVSEFLNTVDMVIG
jgi:hypothetical protein